MAPEKVIPGCLNWRCCQFKSCFQERSWRHPDELSKGAVEGRSCPETRLFGQLIEGVSSEFIVISQTAKFLNPKLVDVIIKIKSVIFVQQV